MCEEWWRVSDIQWLCLIKDWKSHYERLLNVEFMWNKESLPDPKIGPTLYVTVEWFLKPLQKWKLVKQQDHLE